VATTKKASGKTTNKKSSKSKSTTAAKKTTRGRKAAAAKKAEDADAPTAEGPEGGTAPLDRRTKQDRRKSADRRKQDVPVAKERRTVERRAKVNRRRQIDPTTCERDYTPDEIEFMSALDQYKRASGRMFPTCSEVLEVLMKLGYRKQPEKPGDEAAAKTVDEGALEGVGG